MAGTSPQTDYCRALRRAPSRRLFARRVLLLLSVTSLSVSCQRSEQPAADNLPATEAATPTRVVSLSPAMSEAMVEIGLGDRVVGRSPWCVSLGPEVPVVGTLLDCDLERLLASAPDLVLAQREHGAGASELSQFCTSRGIELLQMRIDSLDDVESMMVALGSRFGGAAKTCAANWQSQLHALEPSPAISAKRVLILADGAPFLAFGRRTYLDGVLHRLGAENALAVGGYPTLLCEDLLALDADYILMVADAAQSSSGMAGALEGCGVSAALGGRLHLTGADALTPGPGLLVWAQRVQRLLSQVQTDSVSGPPRGERQ